MKTIEFSKYGSPDDLRLIDAAIPVPKDNEVLIRIHASSINSWDWELLHAKPFANRMMFGLTRPTKLKTLGIDVAGIVEQVGAKVTGFKEGDSVYGDLSACGFGGFAEYVTAPASALRLKPDSISFEQAASLPQAGLLAWQGLMQGKMAVGMRVLINGASGGSGSFAVQIAKQTGLEVTGTCRGEKMDYVLSLGADHVIDYRREDFTRSGKQYDLIVDAQGHFGLSVYRRALKPHGRYVLHGGASSTLAQVILLGPLVSLFGSRKLSILLHKANVGLDQLEALVTSGRVIPSIDRTFPLSEIVEALKYYGDGNARGKIVITMQE